MILLLSTMLRAMILRTPTMRTAFQINKYPPFVILRPIVQPHLPTNLLNPRPNLLHMIRRMIPLPHDDVQVRRATRPLRPDPVLEDPLGLLYEEAVQVNAVLVDAALGVVLAEDEVSGLAVVVVHFGGVALALVGELFGSGAIAVFVGLTRLWIYQKGCC